jgi:hypothetical protein
MEGRMKQGRFSEIGMSRPRKQTRRAMFLDQMTAVVPWDRFEQLIMALLRNYAWGIPWANRVL